MNPDDKEWEFEATVSGTVWAEDEEDAIRQVRILLCRSSTVDVDYIYEVAQ